MEGYHPTEEDIRSHDPYKEGTIPWPKDRTWSYVIKNGMRADMGMRWSIRKLSDQLHDDIYMCGAIFIITEAMTAITCTYWRPLFWSLFWIFLTVVIGAMGLMANAVLNTFGLILFTVCQIMFSAINLQHVNALRAESLRECSVRQLEYRNCDVPSLSHCINADTCTKTEILNTCSLYGKCCMAPGKVECDDLATVDIVFWLNFVINFLSYAEPCFYAILLVIRQEIVQQAEAPNGETTKFRAMLAKFAGAAFKPLPKEAPTKPWDWRPSLVLAMTMSTVIVLSTIYMKR